MIRTICCRADYIVTNKAAPIIPNTCIISINSTYVYRFVYCYDKSNSIFRKAEEANFYQTIDKGSVDRSSFHIHSPVISRGIVWSFDNVF